jgi:hypothetical protein
MELRKFSCSTALEQTDAGRGGCRGGELGASPGGSGTAAAPASSDDRGCIGFDQDR